MKGIWIKTGLYPGWIAVLLLLITGCEHLGHGDAHEISAAHELASQETRERVDWATVSSAADIASEENLSATTETIQPVPQRIVEIGERPLPAPGSGAAATRESTEGDITLNFQDTDLREFIKAVAGDVLNLNYVIDPQVAGKVTLQTARPLEKQELLPLLEEILAMNGATLVQTDGLYQILPRARAVRGRLAPATTQARSGYGVRVVPLDYIAAEEMQKILEPFLTEGSGLRVDTNRNLLILSGTRQELDALHETIDLFDVDWLRGMSFGLYPLNYVTPNVLRTELQAVLGAMQGDEGSRLLQGMLRIVPLERLNSIMLIGTTAAALREAELWLYRLDKPGETVGRRLYVYRLKNAKATELADILSQAFGTSRTRPRTDPATLAPGLAPVELQTLDMDGMPGSLEEYPPSRSIRGSELGMSLPTGETVEIIADDVRNALVVLAAPQDYKTVVSAIEQLDIIPLQVLIEASIVEVTLSDDLNYGVEWFFKNTIDSNRQGRGLLDLGPPGIGPLTPGFSYTIVNSLGDVRFVLNALAQKTNLNVLSSPSLMVLDNQTARINVGDEIPVPTRQAVSTIDPNAPLVSEIQFRRTGVNLDVTPRVNDSGLVTLEIKQEVSNAVVTTSSTIDAPTIQQRSIESIVAVHDGETIVLGGLISDSQFRDNRGVPILHNLPIIGNFFGARGREYTRTELLVLLTPRVVRDSNESRAITEEFRRKLRGIQPIELVPVETGS